MRYLLGFLGATIGSMVANTTLGLLATGAFTVLADPVGFLIGNVMLGVLFAVVTFAFERDDWSYGMYIVGNATAAAVGALAIVTFHSIVGGAAASFLGAALFAAVLAFVGAVAGFFLRSFTGAKPE